MLLTVSLWLFKNKMRYGMALWPAIFMMIVAMCSLFFILKPWILEMFSRGRFIFNPIGITGALLAGLAFLLLFEGANILIKTRASKAETVISKKKGKL